jgi:cell division protein FtsL
VKPAAARPRSRADVHRPTGQRTAPRAPRRVSGPARPAPRPVTAPAGTAALPRRRQSTSVFERVRALPDHRLVDRLLRSRLWIIVVGVLLGGIVAMQVSLLKLNSGISRAVETTATLERQNGALEADIARLGATERIRSIAESRGMVLPPAGEVKYLRIRPDDVARAAATMTSPSDAARALLANGGFEPGTDPATLGTVTGATVAGGTATATPTAASAGTTVSTPTTTTTPTTATPTTVSTPTTTTTTPTTTTTTPTTTTPTTTTTPATTVTTTPTTTTPTTTTTSPTATTAGAGTTPSTTDTTTPGTATTAPATTAPATMTGQ